MILKFRLTYWVFEVWRILLVTWLRCLANSIFLSSTQLSPIQELYYNPGCAHPAVALSGCAEASKLRPYCSWASPSKCLSIMGVLGPGFSAQCWTSQLPFSTLELPLSSWCSQSCTHSMSHFLHNLPFPSPLSVVRSASWSKGFSSPLYISEMLLSINLFYF